MFTPFKAFFWIAFVITLFGLLVGTLNLMNPDAVHIPFGPNGESAEGLDGVITSVASSGVLGIIFGCLAALMTWIARLGTRKMADIEVDDAILKYRDRKQKERRKKDAARKRAVTK